MQKIVCPVILTLMLSSAGFSQNYTIQTLAGGGVPQNIPGADANLGAVTGIAVDATGNVYIALQSYSAVVRMAPNTGTLTLVAGNGTPGYSGDNGPATSAQLNSPWGLALDAAGNLYIADAGNNLIRKVSNGVITTVAGNTAGVLLSYPTGVAVDTSGNLYIADSRNQVVRKVSGGITVTVAGTGTAGSAGDGGTATSAELYSPWGVAVDSAGNLYIADFGNNAIRKVSNGVITTSSLLVTPGLEPTGVAVDASGNVFFASYGFSVVAEYSTSGTLTRVAGSVDSPGYSGDAGQAINAQLNGPVNVAVDPAGNLYITDYYNNVVRKVASGVITTLAGGPYGYVGDNAAATSALLLNPTSAATDPAGEVYIADSEHNLVRKVVNGVITTVAGTGAAGYTGDGGAATSATLNSPSGVAADGNGNLYISDAGNNVIRKVSGGVITTVAGNGTGGYNSDNIAATSAELNFQINFTTGPALCAAGIALDALGNLYIADCGNNRVRMVSGGMITTVAGNGTASYTGDGLPAASATLSGPGDVKVDSLGNLYIADTYNNVVRLIAGGIIGTVAGNGTPSFGGDNGAATSAELNGPSGVALDSAGELIIADTNNNVVRKVSAGIITTIAGSGVASYGGDNGPALGAGLNAPSGIAADSVGRVFVADSGNNLVRVLTPPCSFTLTTTSIQAPGAGGSFNIGVQTAAFCSWSVSGLPAWITLANASSATGPANVTLIVAAASGAPRNAVITVAGVSVTISQTLVCTYAISPGGQSFAASGGVGSVTVTAPAGCAWSASSTLAYVSFSGASTGSGSGAVSFLVAANTGGDRSGTITVAGYTYTIEQEAASISGLNFVGSMAHLAAEENWTTTFTLVNKSAAATAARLSFFGDDNSYSSDPSGNGPLTLPLTLPQPGALAGTLLAASLDQSMGANASFIATTAGSPSDPVLVGSAQLAATGAVDGFAIFHQIVTTQEAVVPMETRNASSYLLPFDNTLFGNSNLVLGVAVANISTQAATVQVVIRDDTGAQIGTGALPQLAAGDHYQFGLADQFPVTANIRGTIEFDTPAGGRISVLGLRFTPPNNALTTIPALANVGTTGGSIAHLASGGDGWQTTFVLVNTGTTAAQATLSFFADMTGAPLSLPLTFPQGNIAATTAPSVTQMLPPGATLLVVSSAAVCMSGGVQVVCTGSAQLTTNGNVSGFVIFRHNNQEAVVPLESRNANGYVIAFDNTSGTFTGIAVNDVSTAQAVNIPVTVRDDTGAVIATDTISLTGNGHYAFTLATDRYPGTANIRGTIEFDTPAGAQIGALGIRIPAGAAHTYTTLPALAK